MSVVFSATGCGSQSPPDPSEKTQSQSPALLDAPIVEPVKKSDEHFTLGGPIAQLRERMRNAPGRTGILAETKRYSLFDEELIIRDFFQDRPNGYFVDVGCAWPAMANNTYYLEKHLGWTGIGIDALSEYAPAWKRDRPSSRFFSYLVTDHSDTNEVFFKSENVGLSSAKRGFANGRGFGGTLEVEEISTPTTTLTNLLLREEVSKIDLLALDIEGYEMMALRGFDIERFRPELVVVEGKDPAVAAYFDAHGYVMIERYKPFDLVNTYFRPSSNTDTDTDTDTTEIQ
jgi:FkbM family methyltransferase